MVGTVLKVAAVLLGLYALVVLATYYLQQKLLYYPDPRRTPPANLGLEGVEELEIATPDGAHLVAWYGKAAPGQPTLLYFHGNAGALVNRAERFAKYLAGGRGMLMLAYRGYGGSSGRPSERANAADAMLASMRAVARNPLPMAAWGLIVAVLLVVGTLPFFLGLTIVIPVLGHATWHLYRKVIEPAGKSYEPPQPPKRRRYAADFPVNLFSPGPRIR